MRSATATMSTCSAGFVSASPAAAARIARSDPSVATISFVIRRTVIANRTGGCAGCAARLTLTSGEGSSLVLVDSLLPIGEFSDQTGLSTRRLRTYAAEGVLVPAAVDPASGYRYYSPRQVRSARLIDALRQAGMPLADIKRLLSRPAQEDLDAWGRHLEADSTFRRRALELARRLLVESDEPTTPQRDESHQEVSTMTTLQTAGQTDKGPVRENNEDAFLASDRLAMVADGMGGHPSGEVASSVVAGVVRAAFTGRSADELIAAIRAANWAIWDRAAGQAELEGMGTTVCAVGLIDDGRLTVVNVGDSRAYLWHQGSLTQLTRDHSLTAELVERGEIRLEDAPEHPYHGILTRALGMGPEVEVDATTFDVQAGDRLLLCSDGLFNELTFTEIAGIIAGEEGLSSMAQHLVTNAVDHGGRDNVSAVVAEVAA
jgi:PPM family protein phosphatase